MAMNKSEQRSYEAALLEVEMQRVLHITEIPEPDTPAPVGGGKETRGYLVNQYTGKVEHVASTSTGHYSVAAGKPRPGCGTQGSRALYSSLDTAIYAGQQHLLRRFALEVLALDKKTRKEQA